MVQRVKDPALSLQQLGSLLWHRFNSRPRNFPMLLGVAKKNKKGDEEEEKQEEEEAEVPTGAHTHFGKERSL